MKKLRFAVSVAYWSGAYPVSVHGPYPTTGVVWFLSEARWLTWLAQTCSGTMGSWYSRYSMLASGCLVVMTSVVALGADTVAKPATSAPLAVPAAELCMIRFSVQAASAAVMGLPSVHFRPGRMVRVQVRLSAETLHLLAR